MLRILTSTALAATLAAPLAAPAAAETHMTAGTEMMDTAGLIRTRDITGGPVYSIADRYDETAWMDLEDRDYYGYNNYNYGTDYDQIGEIEDIVLDQGGQMIGIVAEVGGFLDIGDKHVLVPVEDLRLVPVDDTSYSYITRLSEEALEELPSVDEAGWN
ncbi:PRC-barrel domain protein [Jannaschia seosinensis]|uniref:PRC-barrel domain protein n=1 Tax=Jannaschia seosinensis TaxID=313367 RepID=A0A0M7B661_9RHOB|nr:PRC-barrel domain-containing protein [Jannaschia seosinensis]CUH30327.1 PRC-barrel domain protein [Jannaschia seosinensis]